MSANKNSALQKAAGLYFFLESSTNRNQLWAGLLASGSTSRRPFPQHILLQWVCTTFVPGYSGGTATDLHRFPYSLLRQQAT